MFQVQSTRDERKDFAFGPDGRLTFFHIYIFHLHKSRYHVDTHPRKEEKEDGKGTHKVQMDMIDQISINLIDIALPDESLQNKWILCM